MGRLRLAQRWPRERHHPALHAARRRQAAAGTHQGRRDRCRTLRHQLVDAAHAARNSRARHAPGERTSTSPSAAASLQPSRAPCCAWWISCRSSPATWPTSPKPSPSRCSASALCPSLQRRSSASHSHPFITGDDHDDAHPSRRPPPPCLPIPSIAAPCSPAPAPRPSLPRSARRRWQRSIWTRHYGSYARAGGPHERASKRPWTSATFR